MRFWFFRKAKDEVGVCWLLKSQITWLFQFLQVTVGEESVRNVNLFSF